MSGDVQAKVFFWIDSNIGPEAERLQLAHLNAAEQLQPLATYELAGRDVAELKIEVWKTAQHVVAAWRHGLQRFALRLYLRGQEQAAVYFPFALAPTEEPSDELGSSEPPNNVGVLSQLMRHNEALSRIAASQALEMMTFQQRSLQTTQDELDRLRKSHAKILEQQQSVILEAEERSLARDLLLRTENRKDQLAERAGHALLPIANAAAKKLGIGQLTKDAGSPVEHTVAQLLGSLDERRMGALLSLFPDPAQQIVLLQLFEQLGLVKREANEDPSAAKH
jgi:hypothetical protein